MVLYKKHVTKEGHVVFERVKSFSKKKIIHKCVVCDRVLRTGKKYCYLHKSKEKVNKKISNKRDRSLDKYF